jgi:hypothetical protein
MPQHRIQLISPERRVIRLNGKEAQSRKIIAFCSEFTAPSTIILLPPPRPKQALQDRPRDSSAEKGRE